MGTRALEFLNNELTNIKTLSELHERVKKRSITDNNDNVLPLYLLELFSIPIEQKEKNDFLTNRISMYSKILNGRKNVLDLLLNKFENDCNDSIKKELIDCFDVEKFKQEVNSKFMNILIQQLRKVEVKLEKKKAKMDFYNKKLEELYNKGNILSVREQVKLYIRELVNIVSNLLTGNYPILNLPKNGENFLKKYGGTLMDNLKDGNELAVELFEKQGLYDENFLNYLNEYLSRYSNDMDLSKSASSEFNYNMNDGLNNLNNNSIDDNNSNNRTDSYENHMDLDKIKIENKPLLVEGVPVRFMLAKEESNMFGVVQNAQSDAKGKNILVNFYFRNNNTDEQVQVKSVEKDRLTVIKAVETLNGDPSFLNGLQVWYKMVRDDGWVGFDKAEIIKVFNNNSKIKDVLIRNLSKNDEIISVKIIDLYMDYVNNHNHGHNHNNNHNNININDDDENKNDENNNNDDDILKRIAGPHTDLKILNQLAITYICKWLKYNISKLEPEKEFSDEVLLQMMRSIHNIVDQSDWKPLIVDLLQANISGNILHLTKLASCSAAVALKRVFKAGLGEINRKIKNNYIDENIYLLSTNQKFIEELNQALHNFCKERAIVCAGEMKDIVFEQTYAVHFEIIEEIFDGCKLFEDNFLTPNGVKPTMSLINKNVKQNLAYRNHQLSLTDVKINKKSRSKELIQEEVKLQFWAIKMLISVPLATKIYAHFLNNILPKNKHLANVLDYSIDCESYLEKYIQSKLLNKEVNGEEHTHIYIYICVIIKIIILFTLKKIDHLCNNIISSFISNSTFSFIYVNKLGFINSKDALCKVSGLALATFISSLIFKLFKLLSFGFLPFLDLCLFSIFVTFNTLFICFSEFPLFSSFIIAFLLFLGFTLSYFFLGFLIFISLDTFSISNFIFFFLPGLPFPSFFLNNILYFLSFFLCSLDLVSDLLLNFSSSYSIYLMYTFSKCFFISSVSGTISK